MCVCVCVCVCVCIHTMQWIDFMDESLFESSKLKLVEAVSSTMGPGSGVQL